MQRLKSYRHYLLTQEESSNKRYRTVEYIKGQGDTLSFRPYVDEKKGPGIWSDKELDSIKYWASLHGGQYYRADFALGTVEVPKEGTDESAWPTYDVLLIIDNDINNWTDRIWITKYEDKTYSISLFYLETTKDRSRTSWMCDDLDAVLDCIHFEKLLDRNSIKPLGSPTRAKRYPGKKILPSLLSEVRKKAPDIYNKFNALRGEGDQWKTDLTADMGDIGF